MKLFSLLFVILLTGCAGLNVSWTASYQMPQIACVTNPVITCPTAPAVATPPVTFTTGVVK